MILALRLQSEALAASRRLAFALRRASGNPVYDLPILVFGRLRQVTLNAELACVMARWVRAHV